MKILLAFIMMTVPGWAAEPAFDWNSETIHCGQLVYGDNQTAICFADAFLADSAKETGLNISAKFTRIQLAKDEVFNTPLCMFTGQGDFTMKESERANLRRYLQNGGFVLSSPGCSNTEWNKAFRREIALALPGYELKEIPMSHEIFSTVHRITSLSVKGSPAHLQGVFINGRLALVHSPEGLNDAKSANGCCCCGGAEISEARQVNVNAVAYALLH
jgi:hypothetical protein